MSIESPSSTGSSSASAGPAWRRAAAGAVLRRPDLWWTALKLGARHAPRRWWASPPFLPAPDPSWMSFRYETAVGRADGRPTPSQLIEYLEWSRDWR